MHLSKIEPHVQIADVPSVVTQRYPDPGLNAEDETSDGFLRTTVYGPNHPQVDTIPTSTLEKKQGN